MIIDVIPVAPDVGPISVGVLTTLIDWTDVSKFEGVVASLENQDPAVTVTFIIEQSAFAIRPDESTRSSFDVSPLREASQEFSEQFRKYFRLSAQCASTATVRAALRGSHRWR